MRIGELCRREVVTCDSAATLPEVARAMRASHVGTVVVVDEAGKPAGILTDRDIVVEVVAAAMDPRDVAAGEAMTPNPVVVPDDEDAGWCLKVMREKGVRRLPVVDATGRLAGIVALDDLLEAASTTLADVVQAIGTERLNEDRRRKPIRSKAAA